MWLVDLGSEGLLVLEVICARVEPPIGKTQQGSTTDSSLMYIIVKNIGNIDLGSLT